MPKKFNRRHGEADEDGSSGDEGGVHKSVAVMRTSHAHARVGEGEGDTRRGSDEDNADGDDGAEAPAILSLHQREEAQRAELFKRYAVRNWIFIYLLGLINNFHYNLVIAGANTLASSYGMKSLVALISFTNVFFGIIARIVNAFVANHVSYNIRMTLMSTGTLIGLFFVSMSGPFGRGSNVSSFVVLLVGVAFTGTSYCYGESVALTFVQRYPPKTVGAWGSGTGTSGVIASLLFLFLTNAGLSEQTIFLISMPLALCYWLIFNFGIVAPHRVVYVTETDADGHTAVHRVTVHSGHEDKIMRELHERVRLSGGTMSEPEYKMIINFRGLSWKSIPLSPSEKRAVEEDAEEQHYAAYRCQSEAGGAAQATASGPANADEPVENRTPLPAVTKSFAPASEAVGEGVVETCLSPVARGPAAADTAPMHVTAASTSAPVPHTHGDDLYYPCCRALCGCYARDCSLRRWWRLHGQVIGTMHNAMVWYMFNLAVVYITEYAAQFMAPFSFYCRDDWEDNFWIKNSYTVTQFCYQFGVFISRSSLTFGLHIPWVGVLSIIQLCNAILWFVQAKVMFIASHTSESKEVGLAFLLFVWMLFVGLVGGASYVNVFYLILCKGRQMQAADEKVHTLALLRHLRGDKPEDAPTHTASHGDRDAATADQDDHEGNGTANASASASPAVTATTTTTACGGAPLSQAQREEQESAFAVYSPAEGDDDAVVDAADLLVSVTSPVKKVGGKSTVDGQPLGSSRSSESGSEDDDGQAAVAFGGDGDEDGARLAADAPSSSSAHDQDSGSRSSHRRRSKGRSCWRWWPFGRHKRTDDAGVDSNNDDGASLSDFKPLTPHEEVELEELSIALGEEWQSRRELAMAIGALYAMVGICIGTILDVIFTNTVLKHTVTCG